jgi:methylthioribose-1-phosphate isomerase
MRIEGKWYRTIWPSEDEAAVNIIDQTRLPHDFSIDRLETLADATAAIRTMKVRGAPLIGATAAYGVCLALREDASDESLNAAVLALGETRPTAVNLRWALARMQEALAGISEAERAQAAWKAAAEICDQDVAISRRIGDHGEALIRGVSDRKNGGTVHVLTHCNAGWLATVDWGTALAPIYAAHDAGVAVHVWVDETRPRNQGASLTAFELGAHGVPHTLIVDNAGGHLMQRGSVDLCVVGTDRTSSRGDVANKIGTYLKALAAFDNAVPFYVALPSTTIDWGVADGIREIPIEEREQEEVTRIWGRTRDGDLLDVAITPAGCEAHNPAFDVTPARLVTGLITERGVCEASREGLLNLFPERRAGGSMW